MAFRDFIVRRIGDTWFVFRGTRVDTDLTDAFRRAVREHAPSTQRKIARFIQGFINFPCFEGEPEDAFLRERFDKSRERIETYLEALGYEVVDSTREDDARLVRIGTAGSNSALPCCLQGLVRFYARLSRMGLRPRANPMKVDNWHLMPPDVRRELEESIYGRTLEYGGYRGSNYVVVQGVSYALRMEDPIGLGERVLAAGRAFGWPDAILDQVTVMDEDGVRWVDTYALTAADWALSSGFGRSILAPNKGSDGERVKRIVISQDAVAQLKRSFDRDPLRPSFKDLEALRAARDFEALSRIYLFPSTRCVPFTYHTFNNSYFRPAMEQGQVTIASETSIVRATAHRLRSARMQEEAEHIYRPGRTDEQIKADERALKEDVHIKSEAALNRYVGRCRIERGEAMKIERADRRWALREERRLMREDEAARARAPNGELRA
jgi:hypothetical protein